MYIKANIDDCALIINEFLSEDLFKKISNYDFKKLLELSSYEGWGEFLFKDKKNNITMKEVKTSNIIAGIEKNKIKVKDDLFKELIETLINCPFIPYQVNSKIDVCYYEYEKFSGINWHDDGKYTLNYSLYIHNEWDINWGGETLIDTNRGLPLVSYPYPNVLLAVKNKIQHKVCPTTGPKNRKVLQVRGVFYE